MVKLRELCENCIRIYSLEDKRKDKGVCFGLSTQEGRNKFNIPEVDKLRFCTYDSEGAVSFNLHKGEVKELIKGLRLLLSMAQE